MNSSLINLGGPTEQSTTVGGTLLRYLGVAIFTAFSLFFIYLLLSDGYWPLALMIGVITFMVAFVFLSPKAYPLRWMSPGLSFMLLISVYPILFTVYISLTNYGTGHLLPKQQTIDVLVHAHVPARRGKSTLLLCLSRCRR